MARKVTDHRHKYFSREAAKHSLYSFIKYNLYPSFDNKVIVYKYMIEGNDIYLIITFLCVCFASLRLCVIFFVLYLRDWLPMKFICDLYVLCGLIFFNKAMFTCNTPLTIFNCE